MVLGFTMNSFLFAEKIAVGMSFSLNNISLLSAIVKNLFLCFFITILAAETRDFSRVRSRFSFLHVLYVMIDNKVFFILYHNINAFKKQKGHT